MNPPIELESLVDIYDQPFVIVDQQLRVVVVNRAFEEAYGPVCDFPAIAQLRRSGTHSSVEIGAVALPWLFGG